MYKYYESSNIYGWFRIMNELYIQSIKIRDYIQIKIVKKTMRFIDKEIF